jgi:hypothetical protein
MLLDGEGPGVQLELEAAEANLFFRKTSGQESTKVEGGDLDEIDRVPVVREERIISMKAVLKEPSCENTNGMVVVLKKPICREPKVRGSARASLGESHGPERAKRRVQQRWSTGRRTSR